MIPVAGREEGGAVVIRRGCGPPARLAKPIDTGRGTHIQHEPPGREMVVQALQAGGGETLVVDMAEGIGAGMKIKP